MTEKPFPHSGAIHRLVAKKASFDSRSTACNRLASMVISPSSDTSKQFKHRSNVDFGQPNGLIAETKSPLSILNDLCFKILFSL
jgi:hypothetical protein